MRFRNHLNQSVFPVTHSISLHFGGTFWREKGSMTLTRGPGRCKKEPFFPHTASPVKVQHTPNTCSSIPPGPLEPGLAALSTLIPSLDQAQKLLK